MIEDRADLYIFSLRKIRFLILIKKFRLISFYVRDIVGHSDILKGYIGSLVITTLLLVLKTSFFKYMYRLWLQSEKKKEKPVVHFSSEPLCPMLP